LALINNKNDTIKALVVDDEAISRQITAKMIEAQGFEVETAQDGQEALSLWQDKQHALIITDCNMPIMDGFHLAQSIRAIEATEQCKPTNIIALTANASEEEQIRCRQAGMNNMITKPVTIAKLTTLIAHDSTPASKETEDQAALDHATVDIHQPMIDFTILAEVFPEKNKQATVLRELHQHMKENYKTLMIQVNHADVAGVESIAHKMKGACKMVSVNQIANLCTEIEHQAKHGQIVDVNTLTRLSNNIQQFDAYLASQSQQSEQS